MSDKVKDMSALAAIASIVETNLLAKCSDGRIGFVSSEQILPVNKIIVDSLDELYQNGVFKVSNNTQGKPQGAIGDGSIVLCFVWDGNAAHQIYLEYRNQRLWYRYCSMRKWWDWKLIAFGSANSGGVKSYLSIICKKGGRRHERKGYGAEQRNPEIHTHGRFGRKTDKGELRRNDSTGSISYSSGRSQVWVSSRNIRVRCPYSGSISGIYGTNIYTPQLDGRATFVSFQGGAQWEFQQMDCLTAILCDNSILSIGKEAVAA